jgi:hypothetical protein
MTAPMKKIACWCVIYLFNKSKLHFALQKYMDVAVIHVKTDSKWMFLYKWPF